MLASFPRKACAKHPPGHFGEYPVITEPGEGLQVGSGRQQPGERLGAALALLGPSANGVLNAVTVCGPLNDG